MTNLTGALIIAVGLFLFVVGWRGTQHAVFPGLFPKSGGTSGGSSGDTKTPGSQSTDTPDYGGINPYQAV